MDDDTAAYYGAGNDDDGGFEGYEPTTVDPGHFILLGTFAVCLIVLFIFALCLKRVRRRRKLRKADKNAALNTTLSTADSSSVLELDHDDSDSIDSFDGGPGGCELCFVALPGHAADAPPVQVQRTVRPRNQRNARRLRGATTLLRKFMSRKRSSMEQSQERSGIEQCKPKHMMNDGVIMIDDDSISVGRFKVMGDDDESRFMEFQDLSVPCGPGMSEYYHRMDDDNDAKGSKANMEKDGIIKTATVSSEMEQAELNKATHPPRLPGGAVSKLFHKFRRVARVDNEMKKLVGLAVPYTLSALFECVFGLLQLVIIGKLLGTRALSAYIAVDFLLTLTSMWLEGAMSSLLTICSQAVGADKPVLAGQYVQIAVITSQFLYLPQLVLWIYCIEDVILWLGFDEETAAMGSDYATIVLFHELYSFAHDGICHLLDVTDHETFSAIISIVYRAVEFGIVLAVALLYSPTLRMVGIIHFAVDVAFFCFGLAWILCMGWFRDYWRGLVGSCAMANFRAVKHFFKTATPLSLGYVLTTGEWEVLFCLAGVLGPAEVAAWGIAGEIWDALEAVTLAVADAAEVRAAYLLGQNKPERAKRSAQKSLLLGVIVGVTGSVFLIGFSVYIPEWVTNDLTLQVMIRDLLPLMSVGNIMLTIGSVSWILLGAQGRYALSTGVAFVGSWFVTLPLALLSTLYFGYDLSGLVCSVIVGYMTSGMVNTLLLLDSDWEYLAMKVLKHNNVDMEEETEPDVPKQVSLEVATLPVYSDDDDDDYVELASSAETKAPKQGNPAPVKLAPVVSERGSHSAKTRLKKAKDSSSSVKVGPSRRELVLFRPEKVGPSRRELVLADLNKNEPRNEGMAGTSARVFFPAQQDS